MRPRQEEPAGRSPPCRYRSGGSEKGLPRTAGTGSEPVRRYLSEKPSSFSGTEPQVVVPVGRIVTVPVRRPAVPGVVVPAPAPIDPVRAASVQSPRPIIRRRNRRDSARAANAKSGSICRAKSASFHSPRSKSLRASRYRFRSLALLRRARRRCPGKRRYPRNESPNPVLLSAGVLSVSSSLSARNRSISPKRLRKISFSSSHRIKSSMYLT